MVLNDRTMRSLEFSKILSKLSDEAMTERGKRYVLQLTPFADIAEVEAAQLETEQAKRIIALHGSFPVGPLPDLHATLKRASLGGGISPVEMYAVYVLLRIANQLSKYLTEKEEAAFLLVKYPLELQPFLENRLEKTVDDEGSFKDTASSQLGDVRRRLNIARIRLQEKVENLAKGGEYSLYLQDQIVTMRNGRYVVPVRAEFKHSFPGILHDQSASGATVYMEPMALVEAGNNIKELVNEEKAEINKIISEISALIGAVSAELRSNLESIAQLDLASAKARLALKMGAEMPETQKASEIKIISGKHPLLGASAVPVDIEFGPQLLSIIITGPNTGGKTVTLKTIGLFCAMHQSGLQIPARPGSKLSVFKKIRADIGDEQSIEQSLSTFSSHMGNIINILNDVDMQSLVLLDELGAGTDPSEGAALAMSIIDDLLAKGIKSVVTTHYSELKVFAHTNILTTNACMEFDDQTLKPTYRLLLGIPGRSNAFEIASRLGLGNTIIENAKKHVSQDNIQLEELLVGLQQKTGMLESETKLFKSKIREQELLKEELLLRINKLKNDEDKQKEKARQEALDIIRDTEQEAKRIYDEYRNKLARMQEKETVAAQSEFKQQIKDLRKYSARHKKDEESNFKQPRSNFDAENIKPGMKVKLLDINESGVVISVSKDKGEAVVQAGIMKMKVSLSNLAVDSRVEKQSAKRNFSKLSQEKASNIKTEIDLRGLRPDEAVLTTEKYVDDAYLAGLPKIYIIHGKGTGSLKLAIREMLAGNQLVENFASAAYNEGGDGVTVARMKTK